MTATKTKATKSKKAWGTKQGSAKAKSSGKKGGQPPEAAKAPTKKPAKSEAKAAAPASAESVPQPMYTVGAKVGFRLHDNGVIAGEGVAKITDVREEDGVFQYRVTIFSGDVLKAWDRDKDGQIWLEEFELFEREAAADKPAKPIAGDAKQAGQAKDAAAKPAKAKPAKAKAAGEPKAKKMSAIDAAAQVLAEEKTPKTCKELIGAMAQLGLWKSPGGATPWATLYSAINREIGVKGKAARFKQTAPGKFAANG